MNLHELPDKQARKHPNATPSILNLNKSFLEIFYYDFVLKLKIICNRPIHPMHFS